MEQAWLEAIARAVKEAVDVLWALLGGAWSAIGHLAHPVALPLPVLGVTGAMLVGGVVLLSRHSRGATPPPPRRRRRHFSTGT